MKWIAPSLLLVSLISASAAPAVPPTDPVAPLSKALLYSAVVDGNAEVFQLKELANGNSIIRQLSSGKDISWLNPKLSPDGQTVLATRYQTAEDIKEVVTFPLSTTSAAPPQVKIVAGSAKMPCEDGSWSYDGTHIVYKEVRDHREGYPFQGDIVEVDYNGLLPNKAENRNVITADSRFDNRECTAPVYSRNDQGQRIAFEYATDLSQTQLFVVDLSKNKAVTQLTTGQTKHWAPTWHPNKNQIVYVLNNLKAIDSAPPAVLHILNLDNQRDRVFPVPYQQDITARTELVDPSFSPTGRLAFSARWTAGHYKLFELPDTFDAVIPLMPYEEAKPDLFGADYYFSRQVG